jgi:hypothetical protein
MLHRRLGYHKKEKARDSRDSVCLKVHKKIGVKKNIATVLKMKNK